VAPARRRDRARWDTIDSYGPDLDFFSREVPRRFSLWNPYDKGGYPLFCDPQIDRYYPFNWPFGDVGRGVRTSWWLVQIKVLAHHLVGRAACICSCVRAVRATARDDRRARARRVDAAARAQGVDHLVAARLGAARVGGDRCGDRAAVVAARRRGRGGDDVAGDRRVTAGCGTR